MLGCHFFFFLPAQSDIPTIWIKAQMSEGSKVNTMGKLKLYDVCVLSEVIEYCKK